MKDGLEYSLEYIRSGDYFIPNLTLPEETRPMGKWGRMHREYLKEHNHKLLLPENRYYK